MNEIIQSVILGVVQGLTEFLPVSSSAHLNLFPWIFQWEHISESFDVALHFGTLLAICVFFFKDWLELIKGGFFVAKDYIEKNIIKNNNLESKITKKEKQLNKKSKILDSQILSNGKMFWFLVLATIPAGILSLILDKFVEIIVGTNLDLEMALIGIALIVMGIILYIVDKKSSSKITYENITCKQSLLIGMSQALAAAFPGVSRSGITMTVARMLKIDRESAAKFSFLLATPIVAAAVVFDLASFTFSTSFFVGILASFVSGILVIKFLMEYLKKGSFKIFAIYRILLGLMVFGIILFR